MRRLSLVAAHIGLLACVGALSVCAELQRQARSEVEARYQQWDRRVEPDTKLAQLKDQLTPKYGVLPPGDLEDQSALPLWFRIYMRLQDPELPKSGPYQYPRTANRILQRFLDAPNSDVVAKALEDTRKDPR